MNVEITDEHRWLARLVGSWDVRYPPSATGGMDVEHTAVETVRMVGGIWAVCEAIVAGDGEPATNIMTLGYDPARKRFVGTFIASMMTHQWVYEGELDASGTRLELITEGPSFAVPGEMQTYRDSVVWISDDERLLTSELFRNGEWSLFMRAEYKRRSGGPS